MLIDTYLRKTLGALTLLGLAMTAVILANFGLTSSLPHLVWLAVLCSTSGVLGQIGLGFAIRLGDFKEVRDIDADPASLVCWFFAAVDAAIIFHIAL